MSAITPVNNNVLIRPDHAEKSRGGILVPESVRSGSTCSGKVVAIDPNLNSDKEVKMNLSVGSSILYSAYGIKEVDRDGEKLVFVNAKDIIAII